MKRFACVVFFLLFFSAKTPATCPDDMVWVEKTGTCLDRYEWPNKKGVHPATAMSGTPSPFDQQKGVVMDAEALCASVGKRPCRYEEWVPACEGPDGSKYPFGSKLPTFTNAASTPCNYAQWFIVPDAEKVFERDPKELARLDQSDPSGTRGCVSASGAEDMMGNVEEWIQCPPSLSPNGWCLAGRYWSGPEPCSKVIVSHDPGWHYYETGFRCCRNL